MPKPQDEEFIRFAVASGHMTREQGADALSALRGIEDLGGAASAPDMLTRRGVLNDRQVGLIHQAIAASKASTRVPRELGGFELLEKVGQGGMGSVFKARQKDLERVVALKILSPRLARNREFVERFLREARSAGRLNHPNIVAAIDVGESEGFYYFAMEYADGETLSRLIAREGRLPESRALAIATEVAAALDHAHQRGLIHRDIKPENIIITRDDRVRVTDFGLAKALGADADAASDADKFLGTPAYVAPEQIRSEPDIDCRADIFSLGVTLFQMLTGELPFTGANPMAIAAAVVSEPLPSLRKLCPELPLGTTRVVEKMTAKDRADRYATPADVVAALSAAAAAPRIAPRAAPSRGAAPGAPPRRGTHRRRSTPVGVYVGAFVAVALLFALVIYLATSSSRRRGVADPAVPEQPVAETPETPAASSEEAVAQRLLGEITQAMNGAAQFAAANPAAFASQMARYRRILADYPPEKRRALPDAALTLLRQAEAELGRLDQESKRAAQAEAKARNERADALFNEGRFADGLRLFDTVPPELRSDAADAELRALRQHYVERAVQEFETLDAKGQKLVQQDRLDEAKALYEGARAWGVAEVSPRAATEVAKIDALLKKRATVGVAEAQAVYIPLVRTTLDRLAAHDYAQARKLVDGAIVDPKLAPVRGKLRGLQDVVRAAGEVWALIEAGAKRLKADDPIRIGGVGGKFVRLEGDKMYFKTGPVTAARSLNELRPVESLALIEGDPATAGMQLHGKFALFLLAERDYHDARKGLEAAKAKGTDVSEELGLLDRFGPRPCPACHGDKEVTCPDCQGKGYSRIDEKPCPVCKGRGGGRCGFCRGTGFLRCPSCDGTGRSGLGTRCMECGGSGRVRCTHCGGDGYLTCKNCKGKGIVSTPVVCERCKGKKTIPCDTCGGQGFLPPIDLAADKPRPPAVPPPAPAPTGPPLE